MVRPGKLANGPIWSRGQTNKKLKRLNQLTAGKPFRRQTKHANEKKLKPARPSGRSRWAARAGADASQGAPALPLLPERIKDVPLDRVLTIEEETE